MVDIWAASVHCWLKSSFLCSFLGFFCELSSRIHNAFFTVLLSVSSSHFCTHIWELPWPNCGILLWVLLNLITFLWTHFSSSYRITAWLVLEGTLKRLKCLSVFKRLGTSATILGSLFQCSTIFTVKECFPMPSLNLLEQLCTTLSFSIIGSQEWSSAPPSASSLQGAAGSNKVISQAASFCPEHTAQASSTSLYRTCLTTFVASL